MMIEHLSITNLLLIHRKKVVENPGSGKPWFCPSSDKYYDNYEPRYIFSIVVTDHTRSDFVSVFNDIGKLLLKEDATTVAALKDNNDLAGLSNIMERPVDKRFIFDIKAVEDSHGDEQKVRCVLQSVEALDYASEAQRLITEIRHMQ